MSVEVAEAPPSKHKVTAKERDCWRTPLPLFRELHAVYNFKRDIASTAEDCLLCRTGDGAVCGYEHYPQFNALEHAWSPEHAAIYCNGPFSGKGQGLDPTSSLSTWVRRAAEQVQYFNLRVVCFLPADPSVGWWRHAFDKATRVWLLEERVHCERPDGSIGTQPRGGTVIMELGQSPVLGGWKGRRVK